MRRPPPQDSALQAPALPGFVVFGLPKTPGSSCSASAGGPGQLPFERVQMSALGTVSRVARKLSAKALERQLGDLFERVQMNRSSVSLTVPKPFNDRLGRPFERVQMKTRSARRTPSSTPFMLIADGSFERVQTDWPQPPLLFTHCHSGGTPMPPPK
jgi:hypothetical protein